MAYADHVALGRAYIEIVGDVRKFAPDLARGLTSAFKISGVGAIAAGASTQLIGLAGSLAQVGGAAVALPAAIGVYAAATGAARLATAGLGEAMTAAASGDAKALEKAMEGLSPKAQSLAREVQKVAPALQSIKTAAQDAFTGQLVGQIQSTATVLAGPLRVGLAGIATEYGNAARRALEFARESATVGVLNQVFAATRTSVAGLAAATGPVLTGLRDITGIGLPLMTQLGVGAGNAATKFGEWLSKVAQSGQAAAWLSNAVAVLRQLGDIAQNVGGILSSVFQAAATSVGGGLLGGLVRVTDQLRAFFESAEGSAALTSVFTALGTVASGVGGVFGTLLTTAGQLAPALMPIAQAVVPALQAVASNLGPAIAALGPGLVAVVQGLSQGVQAIAPALGPLGGVISSILSALAPLLPVVGQLVAALAGPLTQVLAALGPLLAPLVSALAPILSQIAQTLSAVLAPVAQLLVQLFTQLGPPLGQIAAALGASLAPALAAAGPLVAKLVEAVMPLVPVLISLLGPVLEVVTALAPLNQIAVQLATALVGVAAPLIRFGAGVTGLLIAKTVAPLIRGIANVITFLVTPLASAAGWLAKVAGWLSSINWAGVGSAIGGAFSSAWTAVSNFFLTLGRWFAELPGKIGSFLAGLPQQLWQLFTSAGKLALQALGVAIGLIIYAVTQLPGQVVTAAQNLPGMLRDLVSRAITGAKQVFSSGVTAVVSYAQGLAGRTVAALSSLGSRLSTTFRNAVTAGRNAAVSGFNSILSHIGGIPRKITGYAGRFLDAGKALIKKLVDGLGKVPSLGKIATAIASTIKSQLNRIIGAINSGIANIDNVLPGSLPRIPMLANGAILRRPTLMVGGEAGDEVVIPLTRPRRARQLAEQSGLSRLLGDGGGSVVFGPGSIQVVFQGVVPTRAEAVQTGRSVGEGVQRALARRSVATTVRTI
ncbi:hypothetical protein Ait01nite_020410 [Actinoplanes italicus]|nr:hypothetical protein Ait01nite_020410 [Actinoplanes italicus]